ncbi:type 1 glutamine amidotransferase [Aspergillus saccharolyticus JOP 1030-1]|uniref:Class I glutamine amidotransferase-like protein n=1 Tax=Aspergillus saccharolyticus JOP 1030-1 TaxID=1450539 RepID=A0A318ZPY6_9EURO|nr:class I glutamine amidotransferase-like protein [Aspergillus saccharolyticus JOP 1030-1]PYH46483.1 class I glutamine amidotransferase-like protein [Aspergillus saccharolyticus JOP 1030-1]
MTPPTKHLHIAILDTDVPVPTVYARRGLYSSQFRHLLRAAAATINNADYEIHTTAFDVVGGELPAYGSLYTTKSPETTDAVNPLSYPITGILITGSSAAAYATTLYPWIDPLTEFLRTVHAQYPAVRVFGSCFGHQLIARALLSSNPPKTDHVWDDGREAGPYVAVEPAPGGREVGLKTVTLFPEFVGRFPEAFARRRWEMQMIHGDHVRILRPLPQDWCVIGRSEECAVQGLYWPGQVLSYQGHFEFDAEVNRETCLEFARRENWSGEDVGRWVQAIGDGTQRNDAEGAAEVVEIPISHR